MDSENWTKGPWVITEEPGCEEYWVTFDHHSVGPASIVKNRADANLISAAPDLAEYAILMERYEAAMDADDDVRAMVLYGDAKKVRIRALAKARGQS